MLRRSAATSSSTRLAWRTARAPTTVGDTWRVLRRSTRAPSAVSRAATARETDACEVPNAIAASVKLP